MAIKEDMDSSYLEDEETHIGFMAHNDTLNEFDEENVDLFELDSIIQAYYEYVSNNVQKIIRENIKSTKH